VCLPVDRVSKTTKTVGTIITVQTNKNAERPTKIFLRVDQLQFIDKDKHVRVLKTTRASVLLCFAWYVMHIGRRYLFSDM
jgi:hypothetical protein